jgi:anthranilate synthase component 1
VKALGFDEYTRLSEGGGGGPVPVFREIPGDLLTPVSAFLSLAEGSARAFLLESVIGGERVARYSFLGRGPVATLEARGREVMRRDASGARALGEDLVPALRGALGKPGVAVAGLPRFTGGLVGYLRYDAVRLFEKIPDRHGAARGPLASFSLYRSLVAFDHVLQRIVLIANADPGSRQAFERAQDELDALEADLHRAPRTKPPAPATAAANGLGDMAGYRAAVARAKEYIAAGDIFQVVLSKRHDAACAADPFSVYRALRMVNPSPYMYYIKEEERAIAGASPEMLVRVEAKHVETRPIAGTRPRGNSQADDERLARELIEDEKERAEHVMLVDLGRNDLGRVCRFGSVRVPEFMKVERYSHVLHIVSSVVGELAADQDALDALVATFPAGTLSGAPKIRAMEIIDELEDGARGLYGGALGYLDLAGNLDFCIAIRTVVVEAGRARVQAGAGIVADSDPPYEQREAEAKAGAMLEALQLAGRL